jgi:EAL domain-containing protein (putative c-di-GMP-specific phosphodiesterase class I)
VQYLKSQHCYAAQGFFYSKALPAPEFAALIGAG